MKSKGVLIKQRVSSLCKMITAAVCTLLIGASAFAEMGNIELKNVRGAGLYMNNETGDSFSGELSWNPSYALNADWTLSGNIGVAPMKGETENFIMSEYGLLVGYKFNPAWEVEVGTGIQSWSNQSTASMMNVNVLWNMGSPFLGYFDRLFAGYSLVNQDAKTSELKVGVTMTFGSENKGVVNVTK